jgi:hypothetical protein
MRSELLLAVLVFFSSNIFAQRELTPLPEAITNNAVVAYYNTDDYQIWRYTFSGLDSTKIYSGIHKRAYRYNPWTEVWETLPELPSGPGRIAAAASVVKDKIYIIGGYEVMANGNERSLRNVHIFNPKTNQYEQDGMDLPVPIDDHVQAVWKDSLIYVITGWSNTTNVASVQIYNPSNDTWTQGTPVPNNNQYKAFGASGGIYGDTIVYIGGAQFANNFPAAPYIRKGVINPDNPTEIEWSVQTDSTAMRYRASYFTVSEFPAWAGGSENTYNFDGVAYDGSGGVNPVHKPFQFYNNEIQSLEYPWADSLVVMDTRGHAFFDKIYPYFFGSISSIGGMLENQTVTNRVFEEYIVYLNTVDVNKQEIDFTIFPNPAEDFIQINVEGKFDYQIINPLGQIIQKGQGNNQSQIQLNKSMKGQYILNLKNNEGKTGNRLFIAKGR